VGHSASLTRCRFLRADGASAQKARLPERRVYAGRFSELRRRFAAAQRPQPGARVAPPPPAEPTRDGVFSQRWLLLSHISGEMPDIRAAALVAGAIRNALLSGYGQLGLGDRVPETVSGHAPDGAPSRAPHLAIIPLPFASFPYADGQVMGFALVPPRDSSILDDDELRKVLRHLAPIDERRGERVLTVASKRGTMPSSSFCIGLSPTFEPPAEKRSLDPSLYTEPSRSFATLTPIVLDRHLKEQGEARQQEIAAQIVTACRNIDLPDPELVVPDKHPAILGAPSAHPSARQPAWTRWQLPPSLASRWLTHAVVRFPREVAGPVILGAGRFAGLGLCRPLDLSGR
jgi:CRISPR-associated protein Csb2